MKIEITKQTKESIELPNPCFKKDAYNVYKIYEEKGNPFYDQLSGDSYLRKMSWKVNELVSLTDTTIEHYSAELEKFILSVERDQETLFEDALIKSAECHSEL